MYDEQRRTFEAIDASTARRPGVPQKREPMPAGTPHWQVPARQIPPRSVVRDAQRDDFTATFGTGQAPRGLSGVLRRIAYRIPDYRVRRWALLLVADRVDTLEWQLGRAAKSPLAWAALLAAVGGGAALALHLARPSRKRRPSLLRRNFGST
jgi:hypothetical protein